MARLHVTKTLGPLHFEDLEPHRFEDLVRQLAYDFKDWQTIEATGRSGSDEGIDIRAYERVSANSDEGDDNSDDLATHPMEGNLWVFQCKREKAIGPKKVVTIVSDGVKPESPPYGYIIAAPANFSKSSYDKFREELRARGVMEFYLWGRAELEDMLHQPKNDHILFTFFGISLVSRRKSRATEIRAAVNVKNKLLKYLDWHPKNRPVFLRDTKDVHYPNEAAYNDFKDRPRWIEYPIVEMHPRGIVAEIAKHFAYYDSETEEWDYTDAINLVSRQTENENHRVKQEIRHNIKSFWEFFPTSQQAMYIKKGLIKFDSIVLIDDKGSLYHNFPHIYVDFQGDRGPFDGFHRFLEFEERYYTEVKEQKRRKKFPNEFSKPQFEKIYRDRTIELDDQTRHFLNSGAQQIHSIYDCDNKFQFLNQGDVIGVEQTIDVEGDQVLIKITHKRKELGKDLIDSLGDDPALAHNINQRFGRSLKPEKTITVYEFKKVYKWEIEGK